MDIAEANKNWKNAELNYADAKNKYRELKLELNLQKSKLALKTKEEWAELGITNQQSRDAYITIKTESLARDVLHAKKCVDEFSVESTYLENCFNILVSV